MDHDDESEEARTLYCGNLPGKITEELLYELFLQAGPLERVHIPTDKEGRLCSFGFVTFKHKCSVPYTIQLFEGIQLYGCKLNIKPRRLRNYVNPPNVRNFNDAQNLTPHGRNERSMVGGSSRWDNSQRSNERHNYKRYK